MGFFTRRKRDSYLGFTKYHDEVNRYQLPSSLPSNGLPNTGLPNTYHGSSSPNNSSNIARSQSLSSGAGQAAMAALRMHSLQQQSLSNQPQSASFHRSNSLTMNSNRSNSLRSYTYNPKPSYVAGQPVNRGQPLRSPAQPRSYSLTSQPARSYGSHRASSINSRTPMPINELDEDGEEEAVITTQTTKMVDAQGRLTLITTKTIKTYADGSKEIETTKKNISRSGSRANSLTAAPRNNSILSAGGTAYNLSKIDEDLRDFDYNYEEEGLTLNTGLGEPLKSLDLDSKAPPRDHSAERRRDELRSLESSPSKPLRSILKNTQRPNFSPEGESLAQSSEETAGVAPAQDPLTPKMSPTLNQKPFQPPPSLTQPPKVKVPATPDASHLDHRSVLSSQLSPSAYSSSHRDYAPPHKRQSSSPNSSIKFVSKVETIPIPRSEPKQLTEQELYAKAMEVAMQNVYGKKEDPETSGLDSKGDLKKLVVKDAAKRNSIAATTPGVSENYVYQNHHKEFPTHSMRNGDTKLTTRKERVKEEKKKLKAQEKEERQQKKLEEKEKKDEEKDSSKKTQEVEKEKKKQEKKPLRGFFFGRRKSSSHEVNETSSLLQAPEDSVKINTEADTSTSKTSHLLPGSFLTSPDSETLPQFANHDTQEHAASLVETMPESIPDTEPLPAPSTHLTAEPLPKLSETSQDDVIASTATRKLDDPSELAEDLHSTPQDIMVDVPSIEEQAGGLPSPSVDANIEVPVLNEVASLSSQDEELVDESATARTSLDPWVGSGSPPLNKFISKVQDTSKEPSGQELTEKNEVPVVIEDLVANSSSDLGKAHEKLVIPEAEPLSVDAPSGNVLEKVELGLSGPLEADSEIPAEPIPTTKTSESAESFNVVPIVARNSETGVTPEPVLATPSANIIPAAPITATETAEKLVLTEPVPTALTSEETVSSHRGLNEDSSEKLAPGFQKQTNGTLESDSNNPALETHQPGDANEKVSSPSIEVNSRGEPKKKSKFKHKLFKYFINSYDK